MKKILLLSLVLIVGFSAVAQKSIREKDILGEWKLVIALDEEEILDEIEEDDDIPFFAEWIAEGAVDLAFSIIDDLDIYMDFRDNGKLKIVVEIFGEREVEYTDWYINRYDEVVIGDADIIDHDDDDVWIYDGDRLISSDHGRRGRRFHDDDIYLERID